MIDIDDVFILFQEILIAQVITPKKANKLPEGLKDYSVCEILLSRNIPIAMNEEE